MLVGWWLWRWLTRLGVRPCWSADGTRRCGSPGLCTSFTVAVLPWSLRAMLWATLRAAALRCELRAASCCAALLGVGGPEWHARDG